MWFDRPRSPQNITPPPAGNILNFVNEDGAPAVMDDQGAVTPSATLLGGPVPLQEQVGDPPTAADVIAVYNKQGVGLVQRAPSSGLISALGGSSGQDIDWESGTPGSYYAAGDAIVAAHNSIIMVSIDPGDTPTIVTLPDITPESAGQRISWRNVFDKKGAGAEGPQDGDVIVNPHASDKIFFNAVGVGALLSSAVDMGALSSQWDLESDGLGTWIPVMFPFGWAEVP